MLLHWYFIPDGGRADEAKYGFELADFYVTSSVGCEITTEREGRVTHAFLPGRSLEGGVGLSAVHRLLQSPRNI